MFISNNLFLLVMVYDEVLNNINNNKFYNFYVIIIIHLKIQNLNLY